MSRSRTVVAACLAAVTLLGLQPALSAPSAQTPSGGSPGVRPPTGPGSGAQRPGYAGGHGYYGHSGHHGHYGGPYWGWGLGWTIGVPWGLGLYEPWWGTAYYPSYAYGPVYAGNGYACEQDEDCMRERMAQGEAAPPTTTIAPDAPGEAGGPTQRPLHLNYCDSARAWFPQARTCPGGWRFVRPEYDPSR